VLLAGGSIARLLDGTPGLKVIVTSAHLFGVGAEPSSRAPLAGRRGGRAFIARAQAADPNSR